MILIRASSHAAATPAWLEAKSRQDGRLQDSDFFLPPVWEFSPMDDKPSFGVEKEQKRTLHKRVYMWRFWSVEGL